MNDEPKRRKRPEKPSDTPAARDPTALASMQTPMRHEFIRCPHCREYVPRREECRACGTPI